VPAPVIPAPYSHEQYSWNLQLITARYSLTTPSIGRLVLRPPQAISRLLPALNFNDTLQPVQPPISPVPSTQLTGFSPDFEYLVDDAVRSANNPLINNLPVRKPSCAECSTNHWKILSTSNQLFMVLPANNGVSIIDYTIYRLLVSGPFLTKQLISASNYNDKQLRQAPIPISSARN